VPRTYDIFRAYKGMEGRTNKNNEIKIRTFNLKYKIQIQKYIFSETKFHYKPTYEVGSV
jgi:hypothetical protein